MVSAALVYYYNVKFVEMKLWEYSFPSVANMMSSWCQYEALKYVSFPTQMLAKAFKVVPVMLMGKFMYNKDYEAYEFGSAMVVGFGLYIFLDSSEKIDFKQNVFGDPESVTGAWCGIVLLCCFLAFDSFTGQWQARMFQLHKAMSPLQMMLVMNGFSSVFSFITLVHMEELEYSFNFVYDHPSIALHLLVFVICSIVGQLFIFYTVKNFGAVVFSIIMSIRILFSTLLSCFVYSHPITEMGVLGILIVFGAIAYVRFIDMFMFRGLLLYTAVVIFHIKLCIRKPCSPSIALYTAIILIITLTSFWSIPKSTDTGIVFVAKLLEETSLGGRPRRRKLIQHQRKRYTRSGRSITIASC